MSATRQEAPRGRPCWPAWPSLKNRKLRARWGESGSQQKHLKLHCGWAIASPPASLPSTPFRYWDLMLTGENQNWTRSSHSCYQLWDESRGYSVPKQLIWYGRSQDKTGIWHLLLQTGGHSLVLFNSDPGVQMKCLSLSPCEWFWPLAH